jgi:hypothetical protein
VWSRSIPEGCEAAHHQNANSSKIFGRVLKQIQPNKENKMKKTILVISILAMLSVMVACTKTTTTQAQNGPGGSSAPLSTASILLVGTFKLEGTDLAVTSAQAAHLLPLWQTLKALSSSNTAADEEINALVDQIKGVMTTQQMAKITAMKLTQQDVMSLMSQAGASPNGVNATTTPMALNGFAGGNNAQGGADGAGGPPAGGPQGGGAPGGGVPSGGGDPGIIGGNGGASTTPQAVRQMPNQVPVPLLNALIELLQKKIK